MNLEVYEKAYYFDKKAAAIFGLLRFVSLAAGDDSTGMRQAIYRRILVEDGCAVATDGRRLHFAELPKNKTKIDGQFVETDLIEPGDYRIIFNSKSSIAIGKLTNAGPFPPYKKLLPLAAVEKSFDYRGLPKSNEKFSHYFTCFCHQAGKYGACSMRYLSDLAGYTWQVRIRSQSHHMAVEFVSGNMSAIIMPILIDD